MQEILRLIGEVIGGRAGARLSQQLALKCSFATVLRLVHQAALPPSNDVRVVGVDEWAWRKGQRYGTILVDLERHAPIDLLEDATAESFATWLEKHPTIEVVSRDRGTTFADGATRGAPLALQIADRWHIIHNMGEALEKVLARHHADLKQVMAPEEEQQVIAALDQQVLARTLARSQREQQRIARQERQRATFMRVQELSAQGWSDASIARQLGIHKKTAVKYAQMEHFPEERSDRWRKLAPYLPFLHTQWSAGEQNIASLYQAIQTQGYTGEVNSSAQLPESTRAPQIGQEGHSRRYYPPASQKRKQRQRTVLSSRRATWLALRKPETRSADDQQMLDLLQQAHPQVKAACTLAQTFVQMIRERNTFALEPWLKEATECGIPELMSGVKAKLKGKFIALNCSNANPMDGLDLTCYAIGCLPGLPELCTEDDTEPTSDMPARSRGESLAGRSLHSHLVE